MDIKQLIGEATDYDKKHSLFPIPAHSLFSIPLENHRFSVYTKQYVFF